MSVDGACQASDPALQHAALAWATERQGTAVTDEDEGMDCA